MTRRSWWSNGAPRSAARCARSLRECSTWRARTRCHAPRASSSRRPATATRRSSSSGGATPRPVSWTSTSICSWPRRDRNRCVTPSRGSSSSACRSKTSPAPRAQAGSATRRPRSPSCSWRRAGPLLEPPRTPIGVGWTRLGQGVRVIVGVPKEVKDNEYRVALTPEGAKELTRAGHEVLIETGAGDGSSIPQHRYERAGATIVPSADEVWSSSDLILKVKEPVAEEYPRLREGQILFTYLHLAASAELTQILLERKVSAVAYETVQSSNGRLPLLAPMSEVAGRMAPHVAAGLLEKESGGRGVLMGGVSGVRPAKVLVLGAGMASSNAAWIAAEMEAEVIVVDTNLDRLRFIDQIHKGRIITLASDRLTLRQRVREADVVIGSVLVPGARAPKLVTAEMIRSMRDGAVVIDIAIDQGGCMETSHMTT